MPKPQDIARLPWTQRDEWTTPEFRSHVVTFMQDFVRVHNWADSWSVVERIVNHGLMVAVPLGPTGYPDAPRTVGQGFVPKTGPRVLQLQLNAVSYEVGLEFIQGYATPPDVIDAKLGLAGLSFEADRRLRVAAGGT